jgi:hypothetical protein
MLLIINHVGYTIQLRLSSFSFFFFLAILEIEPRASHSTIGATFSALLFVFCYWGRVSLTLPGLSSNLRFSCLHLLRSWYYGCAPPYPAMVQLFKITRYSKSPQFQFNRKYICTWAEIFGLFFPFYHTTL